MKMNRTVWLAVLALVLGVAVGASGGGDKEKWSKIKARLGLSDAQVSQLEQKFEEMKPQTEQAEQKSHVLREEIEKAEHDGDQDTLTAKKQELKALQEEWAEKDRAVWRSVLTKDQMTKFENMKSENESREREEKERKEKKQ